MLSDHRGYIIESDRSHAHAWKGEKTDRMPDVVTADLASCMHVIDVIEDYEEQHRIVTPV